jgi:hypothetical protein
MKYFLFDKCFDDQIKEFISFINENTDDQINIILDNLGGKTAYASIIIKMINDFDTKRFNSKFTITGNRLFSSGFVIFTKATCKKFILKDAIGAFHKARFSNIDLLTNGKPVWDSDIAQLSSKSLNEDSISLEFMTKAELKKYNRGDDVYFNYERLKEIFPEAEII